ncbi:MAG: terpene cyclase/mutase family protein [Phycisphaerales bacterium]|nr:terpene cyclase/mutase family protein [Phycisphaerales bacterium]
MNSQLAITIAVLLLLVVPTSSAQPADTGSLPPSAQNQITAGEMTPALDEALADGIAYLVAAQDEDGSFTSARYPKHVGVTSLCCLALMADGQLPGRGPYGDVVRRGLEFVLDHSTETGLLASDAAYGSMYSHGFATLFLGEVYGMTGTGPAGAEGSNLAERTHDALTRAVDLIVRSQNHEGGWRYNPIPHDADVSVTICQIMALRSARNAGITVPRATIDKAEAYIRACQNPDGGFRYMKSGGASAWPRSAAGVASLYYAGVYDDQALERGLEYLLSTASPGENRQSYVHYYYYGHYYAVQAMYLAGGDYWMRWWPAIRDELIRRQISSGAWVDEQGDETYATAMALIILQMPKRYLPIFQR